MAFSKNKTNEHTYYIHLISRTFADFVGFEYVANMKLKIRNVCVWVWQIENKPTMYHNITQPIIGLYGSISISV